LVNIGDALTLALAAQPVPWRGEDNAKTGDLQAQNEFRQLEAVTGCRLYRRGKSRTSLAAPRGPD
jgi:surface antigen